MKFKDLLSSDEKQLFKEAAANVKQLKQDKVVHRKPKPQQSANRQNHLTTRQGAEFHFSDEFEPDLSHQGPMKYVREGIDSYEAKNLRRGIYQPELILDLHGLNQEHAKREIAALLIACHKEHVRCVCIVHGIGNRVLKNKVPHWLVQHPDVLAFHQAPLEYGGDGALLALIDIKDKY